MINFGLKEATKDIDVILKTKQEVDALTKALERLDYHSPTPVIISRPYRKMGTNKILENEEGFRWDIFHRQVCRALTLSQSMISRATEFFSQNQMKVLLASKEDIFLFKGITEREADLDDMRLLAESGLNWKTIEEECWKQSASSGRLWENALLENLTDLRTKHHIQTPIEDNLENTVEEKLTEDAVIKAVKKGIRTTREISQYTKMPPHIVRKVAEKMEEKKLLKIDKSGRQHKFFLTER